LFQSWERVLEKIKRIKNTEDRTAKRKYYKKIMGRMVLEKIRREKTCTQRRVREEKIGWRGKEDGFGRVNCLG
jgi:hypothetical protein